MSKEEKIKISVNEEDIQNLINWYDKDIEYIKKLEKENKELQERINKAIDYMNNTFDITSMREFFNHLDNIENMLKGE